VSPFCRVDDIPDGGAIEVRLEGEHPQSLLLLRKDDRVYAYLNICPHAAQALNWGPDRFLFTPEGHLVCGVHGATFEVDTGQCILGPCLGRRLTRFETEVREDQIWPSP
jgi:nitrite reductase/ring-hydroxylating ferredoxin subunit